VADRPSDEHTTRHSDGPLSWTLDGTVSLLEAALEAVHDPIVLLDVDRQVVRYNQAYLEAFDLTAEELASHGFDAILAAGHRLLENASGVKAFWQTPPDRESRDTFHFRDGRVFERFVAPYRIAGRVAGRVVTYRDITNSVRTERALQQSRELLERAQQVAHIGSWVVEFDGSRRLSWSRETYRIFGLQEDEFAGTVDAFHAHLHPDDRDMVLEAGRAARESGQPYDIEHRVVRADGELRWVHVRADIVADPSGRAIRMIGTVQDITERRRLEEQLRQSQKLEAIGRLAGGVAHDLNNALTSIVGYTELAFGSIEPDHPARPDVQEIRRAAERAESVTRQLLAFSRKQPLQPRLFSLAETVVNISLMIRRFIGDRIVLDVEADRSAPLVYGDPGQIEQAIVNLAVNARDAMKDGGTLLLRVAAVDVAAAAAPQADPIPAGRYVELAVQDSGSGMTPAVMAHIFEPFFTTKETGKGTGLGLSMVYGTVKQSGGFISVESEADRGTTFRLRFPPAPAVVREAPVAAPALPHTGGEPTVLVVEDETSVRNLVQVALSNRGYRVIAAGSGADALQLAADQQIDLLLTDANMPGMSGIQLVTTLVAERPALPVIVMSGFTEDLPRLTGLEGQISLLPKPFTPKELRERVARMIGRS
jgi:PAS domain S-box-containing protein